MVVNDSLTIKYFVLRNWLSELYIDFRILIQFCIKMLIIYTDLIKILKIY